MTSFCISFAPRVRNYSNSSADPFTANTWVRRWMLMDVRNIISYACAVPSLVRRTSSKTSHKHTKKRSHSNNIYTQNIILTAHITFDSDFTEMWIPTVDLGERAYRCGGYIHQFMRVLWLFSSWKWIYSHGTQRKNEHSKRWASSLFLFGLTKWSRA